MFLRSTLVTMLAFPALISGNLNRTRGQFPVINGTIGGSLHGNVSAHSFKNPTQAVSSNASTMPTPGKLRVVENSGVCGGVISFHYTSPVVFTFLAETTPGVYQASGYGDLLHGNKSIWFVFYLQCSICFFICDPLKQVLVLCCTPKL
jgi:hypothetical protein